MAVHLSDGEEFWSQMLPDRVEGTPVYHEASDSILVGCYDHHLYCLSASNGDIRCRVIERISWTSLNQTDTVSIFSTVVW